MPLRSPRAEFTPGPQNADRGTPEETQVLLSHSKGSPGPLRKAVCDNILSVRGELRGRESTAQGLQGWPAHFATAHVTAHCLWRPELSSGSVWTGWALDTAVWSGPLEGRWPLLHKGGPLTPHPSAEGGTSSKLAEAALLPSPCFPSVTTGAFVPSPSSLHKPLSSLAPHLLPHGRAGVKNQNPQQRASPVHFL